MPRVILAAVAALVAFTITAQAAPKPRQVAAIGHPCGFDRDGTSLCPGMTQGHSRAAPMGRRLNTQPVRSLDVASRGVSLSGVVAPLADKARQIMADCDSKVISAFRRGARIPTGQMSNHAVGRAVDMQGNPECIYRHLAGWPGGYSTDYHTAPGGKHVHISYNPGGMEWGVKFAHHRGWPRKVAADELSATPVYADSRDRGSLATYAVMNDGSRKGRYKTMKHRRASLALQRHATHVH